MTEQPCEECKKLKKLLRDANRGAERNMRLATNVTKKNIALQKRAEKDEARIAELEQQHGILCDNCGWAMAFPGEPCRCELEAELKELKT